MGCRDNNFERDVIIAMTDNAFKKSARRHQEATGDSYNRARREVDKVHRKPLTATIGLDATGKPMRLTIHEDRDGSHGFITGTPGSTVALASQICRSLTENQKPNALRLFAYVDAACRDQFPTGTTFPAGDDLAHTLHDMMRTRARDLNDQGIEHYWEANPDRVPAIVVVIDGYDRLLKDKPAVGAIETAARTGRTRGIHLILTSWRDEGTGPHGICMPLRTRNAIEDCMMFRVRLSGCTGQFRSCGSDPPYIIKVFSTS